MIIRQFNGVPDNAREQLEEPVPDSVWEQWCCRCPLVWGVARDDETMLGVVGLRVSSLVSDEAVLWAIPYRDNKPTLGELRKGRKMLKLLLLHTPYSLIAETWGDRECKFAKWFGLEEMYSGDNYTMLRLEA